MKLAKHSKGKELGEKMAKGWKPSEFKPASEDKQERISKQWAVNAAIAAFQLNRDRYPDQTIELTAIEPIAKQLYALVRKDWK